MSGRFPQRYVSALDIDGAAEIQVAYGGIAASKSSPISTTGSRAARLYIHVTTDPASNIASYEFRVMNRHPDSTGMLATGTAVIGRQASDTAKTWLNEFPVATGGVGASVDAQFIFEEPDIGSTHQVYVEVKATGGVVKAGDTVKCWLVF